MGGDIGVDSAPDDGARFWFTLPRTPPGGADSDVGTGDVTPASAGIG